MTRTIPSALATKIAGTGLLALAKLVTITRITDSGSVRFTDYDRAIVYSGNTYVIARGIRLSGLTFELNGQSTSMDVVLAADSTLAADDIRSGIYDGALISVSVLDPLVTTEAFELFAGKVGNIEINEHGVAKIEFTGLLSKALLVPIEHYSPSCRVKAFGDARCGINLALHTITAQVLSYTGGLTMTIQSLSSAIPDDWPNLGIVLVTSGVYSGKRVAIRDWVQGTATLSLYISFESTIAAGTALSISRGCARTRAACIAYNNILNFRGEPDVPGQDAMAIQYDDWGA